VRTTLDEIADGIYRISTHTPDGRGRGLVYNQFLIQGDQPMLIHTGMPVLFEGVLAAVRRVLGPGSLRWISAGHASRPDEFGALQLWLNHERGAQVIAGPIAAAVCLRHMTDERNIRVLRDGASTELGGGRRRVRLIATQHVPFWEAWMLLEEHTGTLFCGDLFTVEGNWPATTSDDIVGPAIAFERRMQHFTRSPQLVPTLRRLADTRPRMLACMHGPAFTGDCAAALHALADHYTAETTHAAV
jgi:flavorubredoxin